MQKQIRQQGELTPRTQKTTLHLSGG
jgi:hypothetical protein